MADDVAQRKRGRPPGSTVDVAARRKAALDAAEIEIDKHGDHVGLSAIGARLGYARSALYAVFGSRDDLFDALAARHADRLAQDAAWALTTASDPREQTQATVTAVVSWIAQHRQLAAVLAPRMRDGTTNSIITAPIESALRQALAHAGGDSRAAAPWAHALVAATWAAAQRDTAQDCIDRDQLVEHITNLIWNGLATSVFPHVQGP